jgi:ubiquinone/menaquinone biosynthesis C-methylase UbiE
MPLPVQGALRSARDRIRKRLLFGRLAPLVPPEELMHDGPPTYLDFKQNAEEFLRLYIDLCGLKPHEKVLDVGCGIGRKTIFLTRYLSTGGAYEGIDIVTAGIDWCSRKISRKYPNFEFQLIDVYNKHYNPDGNQRASGYRFPFPDRSFDFVTLGSVLTHMLPRDTENYLAEVRRVLKREGRCLISWFLLNPESDARIRATKSTLNFIYPVEDVCRTTNPADPESAIGYDEAYVLGLYERCGLEVKDWVYYGSWCGRARFLSYQDLILASPSSGAIWQQGEEA